MVFGLATMAGSVSEECLFARPVITGRAGWENQPVGPGHSVLVVDVRPAKTESWVADKAFWAVRRSSVVSRAQTNFVKSKDGQVADDTAERGITLLRTFSLKGQEQFQ